MIKRVLLFIPSNKGTIASVSYNLYNALNDRNDIILKVVSLTNYTDSKLNFKKLESFESFEKNTFYLFKLLKRILWFKHIKKSYNPDITINTLFICSIISVLSGGNDRKIGVFHSPHSQTLLKGKLAHLFSWFSYRFIYQRLDRLFCVSEEVRKSIENSFKNIPLNKLQTVYNIHNVDDIRRQSFEPIQKEYKHIFENPTIIYCGRLDKNKAPERLYQSFSAISNSLANLQLVFVGADNDSCWSTIKKQSELDGLRERVHYLGTQLNPYCMIRNSSLLVSSSYSEGLPGVVIESLIIGTPVVSTNSSFGLWEIMSVEDKYDKNLSTVFFTSYGAITPNNDTGKNCHSKNDIIFLAEAILSIFENKIEITSFKFEEKINAEVVISNYLYE